MKKRQNNSTHASTLQITLSVALISASAILLAAASFNAAPVGASGLAQDKSKSRLVAQLGQVSQALGRQDLSNAPVQSVDQADLPALGNYPNTSTPLSTDTTVTPSATPTNTTRINVSTSTNFQGTLEGYPATGVVRVTDAHPAGTYTVKVTAFDSGGATTTKTFTLTVTTPVTCIPVSFAAAANLNTGTHPQSVAIGDFNGDGKQDLAVANYNSNTVSIRLGDGLGGFSGSTNVSVGTNPISVAIGDFNGDGKQDLAVVNTTSNTVSIRLGDGLGGFSGSTEVSVGTTPYSVAIGDFNGDGKQDLAVANYGLLGTGTTVSIRLGDGLGGFSGSTNVSVGSGPYSVAIGDFNGDGKQDLAVANYTSNTISIRLGDGLGGFSGSTNVSVGTTPYSVAIGDLNGDGRQDLAVANAGSNTVSIRLGDGLGGFSGSTNVSVGTNPVSVAIGDLNGDGRQDLAVANAGSNTVSIRLGDGSGGFSGSTEVSVGTTPYSVAIGDFNGDGKQDLAVANAGSNNVSILLRDCETLGNYPNRSMPLSTDTTVTPDAAPTNITRINVSTSTNFQGTLEGYPATGVVRVTDAHPAGTYTVTVTAFDSGGATTTITTFTLTVTNGCTGTDSFTSAADANPGSGPRSVAIGDFNGDGKQDLAVANEGSATVSIRLGDGLGGFSGSTNVSVGSNPSSVAIGDFNGDGKQDLAVGYLNFNTVSIRLGDGSGGFSGSTNVSVGSNPSSVAIGDFNGDGKQDLAVVNEGSGTVSIRLGDGLGGFSGSTNVSVGSGPGSNPISVAIGDFNGDGKQDLAVANKISNTVSIRLGDGLGGFSGSTEVSVGSVDSLPSSVAIGDFNGDGKQDLAVANGGSNTVSIRLGDGSGGFSGSTEVSVGSLPNSVAIGDFNGDGKQDLAVVNANSGTVSIRLGDGLGGFSGSTNVSVGSGPFSVAIGDFNGDGKQDLAVANYGGGFGTTVSIRLGQCIQFTISGAVSYCSGSPRPVPNVTLSLSGDMTASATTNVAGMYALSSISSGGSYTVTPTPLRNLMPVVDPKPDIGDALRVQAHFQSGGTLLTGCQELAAHTTGGAMVSVGDALAVAQFFNNSVGASNLTGQWRFIPANRTYMPLTMSLTSENYDTYVLGDVTGSVVFPTSAPPVSPDSLNRQASSEKTAQRELPNVANRESVAIVAFSERSMPIAGSNEFIVAVTVSNIDPAIHGQLQAFQGDFTFDSTVVGFQNPPVQKAGLTSEGSWSLMANVLGTGKVRTLRVSCFSLDGGSLSGEETLFELRMTRMSSKPGSSTQLIWLPAPNNFIFIDADLQRRTPLSAPAGKITWSGPTGRR